MTPAKLYYAQNLCLPVDLLRNSFLATKEVDSLGRLFRKGEKEVRRDP